MEDTKFIGRFCNSFRFEAPYKEFGEASTNAESIKSAIALLIYSYCIQNLFVHPLIDRLSDEVMSKNESGLLCTAVTLP